MLFIVVSLLLNLLSTDVYALLVFFSLLEVDACSVIADMLSLLLLLLLLVLFLLLFARRHVYVGKMLVKQHRFVNCLTLLLLLLLLCAFPSNTLYRRLPHKRNILLFVWGREDKKFNNMTEREATTLQCLAIQ